MRSMALTLYLACLIFGETTSQKNTLEPSYIVSGSSFVSASTGESLTLRCLNDSVDISSRYYWYRHLLGQTAQKISSFYAYEIETRFYGDFKDNPRFSLDVAEGQNNLIITDLQMADSATYFCFTSHLYKGNVTSVTTLSVADLNEKTFILQSESNSLKKGNSVTLNCTIYTGSSNGEHQFYWFKSSKDSHPGLIHTHNITAPQCDSKTHSCVYNLPINDLSVSHSGIYYCGVASCGQVLFGNGTKLEVTDDAVIYFWNIAFALISIVSVSVAFLPCVINKEWNANTNGLSNPFKEVYKSHHQQGVVFLSRSKQQRDFTWSECVYNCVKQ